MKSNVNVFVGVVLCAVLCGTFVWLRSAGEEDTWKPNEIYDQVHSSSYGASYTNATFSGSPQEGGLAVSMSSPSSMRARHATNFYAGAHSGIATMPLASSPLASSPMGAASGAGLYTTSSAELKSFGGGGNGGAAMGGSVRGNSVSNPSLQGGAGLGFSPISYTSVRRSELGGTSGTNPSMIAQQGMIPDMASASNFGYAAASNYLNAGTYDQYNAMYGGMGRSNVRGRQNASGSHDNSWRMWLLYTWLPTMTDGWGTQGSDGNWYITEEDLRNAYNAFIAEWNKTMGGGENGGPTWDEWLAWFDPYGSGSGLSLGGNTYFWMPVGDILPLLLLALMYIFAMYLRSKSRTQVND